MAPSTKVTLDVVANPNVKPGLDQAVAETNQFAKKVTDELEKARPGAGAVNEVTDAFRNFAKEERSENRLGAFFVNQIREIIPVSNQAARALAALGTGFAAGSSVGLAVEAAKFLFTTLVEQAAKSKEQIRREVRETLDILAESEGRIEDIQRRIEDFGKERDMAERDRLAARIALMRESVKQQEEALKANREAMKGGAIEGRGQIVEQADATRLVYEAGKGLVQVKSQEAEKQARINAALVEQGTINDRRLMQDRLILEQAERELAALNQIITAQQNRNSEQERFNEAVEASAGLLARQQELYRRQTDYTVATLEFIDKLQARIANDSTQLAQRNAERRREIENSVAVAQIEHIQNQVQMIQSLGAIWGQVGAQMVSSSEDGGRAMARAIIASVRTVVMAYAAEAAAGAFKAHAGIPFIGIAIGTAVAGAAFAVAEGFLSKVPSAAGGYSVPAGMNPLTQLHEQEMVLPRDIANPLRQSLADGGGLGGGPTYNFYGTFIDRASIIRFFSDPAVQSARREVGRNGGIR